MKGKLTWSIFWALAGVFIVIAIVIAIPAFRELLAGSELFLTPFAVFFLLGIALIVLTVKGKVGGTLKKFFLLTGASSAGFFLFVLLHNAFYALGIMTSHITILSRSIDVLNIAFFIIAIFVCPIGFLVGVVGSIVLAIKKSGIAK